METTQKKTKKSKIYFEDANNLQTKSDTEKRK
mgnify:CR=1 FL=1